MRRSRAEVKAFAAAVVNGFAADLIFEFPKIAAAVDKVKSKWLGFLDDQIVQLEDSLVTKFDVSD